MMAGRWRSHRCPIAIGWRRRLRRSSYEASSATHEAGRQNLRHRGRATPRRQSGASAGRRAEPRRDERDRRAPPARRRADQPFRFESLNCPSPDVRLRHRAGVRKARRGNRAAARVSRSAIAEDRKAGQRAFGRGADASEVSADQRWSFASGVTTIFRGPECPRSIPPPSRVPRHRRSGQGARARRARLPPATARRRDRASRRPWPAQPRGSTAKIEGKHLISGITSKLHCHQR